jgi:polysaccharide chain length determinant protein (PEP-CTERM system associated)
MPKVYRASTTILVVRKSFPDEIVRSTVTTGIQDRMNSLRVQVMSRKYLDQIAIELGFVPADASDEQLEAASRDLRRAVRVNFDHRNLSYFEIAVEDEVPRRAALVANRLAELFIQQNTELRQQEATTTLRQVEGWLAENNAALDAEEELIAEYRRERIWELPERLETNIALLQTTQQQLETLVQEIQIHSERLDSLRSQAAGIEPLEPSDGDRDAVLTRLRSELAGLLRTRTEAHPAVVAKRREIEEYLALSSAEASPVDDSGAESAQASELASEIASTRRELRDLEARRNDLSAHVELLQGRIDRTPLREQELASLSRRLDVLRENNDRLLEKRDEAKHAADLEAAKQGEHFQVQDPARVPTRPYKPNPLIIVAMSLAVGLGIGVGSAFLSELLGQTIRTEVEFRRLYRDVPLLVCIPHVERRVSRFRKRRGRKAAAALFVLAASLGMLL